MGKELYERSSAARELYDRADAILGFPLSKISFEGPGERLKQTGTTQPAIFVQSIALTRLLDVGDAAMAAGHSLGEYSALVFSGAMTFEDGLRLVGLRGALMQQAGEERKGTMAAVIGLTPEVVAAICAEAASEGIVQCANFNSPGQIVISGSIEGVRKAMQIAKARGAKLVKELVVSGAFHSPLMDGARNDLRHALRKAAIQDARIPVYANVSGRPVRKAEDIRTLLEAQLTSAVRWEESVRNMLADGATTFVEVGPGKVLQSLVKRISEAAEVRGIDTIEDIQQSVPA